MVMMHNNVRVWNDGVDSLSGDKYKIEGLPPGRPARASHKSLRLKALVTALLELIAHTHDDDDEGEDEKDEIMMRMNHNSRQFKTGVTALLKVTVSIWNRSCYV